MIISVVQLGTVDYATGLRLQQRLVELRKNNQIANVLLLLEHAPVITLGRNAKRQNVLASDELLQQRAVELFECDRGGDVTYHGPSQLVGYPIFRLPRDRYTYVRYIRDLERALLEAIRDLGVEAELQDGLSGVWIGDEKVCAIGVKVDAYGVTSHGFALNVNTDLSYFGHIVPCGIQDKGVTSLERLSGRHVSSRRVERAVIDRIADVFGLQPAGRAIGRTRLESMLDGSQTARTE